MLEKSHEGESLTQDAEMSESEQMYLITTAMLIEDGMEQPVPLPALAQARSIMPASVNQMVRKLADEGLVTYIPYKGIALTAAGSAIAMRILRYRRLWEVFLVKKLKLALGSADQLACRLEHLTTDEVADRLCEYLGDPQLSPQGKPIPRVPCDEDLHPTVCVNKTRVGQRSRVSQLRGEGVAKGFLQGEGIVLGATLAVMALGGDGSVLLEVDGRLTHLSAAIADSVLVQVQD
ncbi:metal-dependent transcriptional regulator [bacterium]|nr:metal-dependent transcriptional regulator [bacterium]